MFELEKIKSAIIDVPNFPIEGIIFKDITPIFMQPELVKDIIDEMAKRCQAIDFDVIVAPESRGYLFSIPLAMKLNKPFAFIRKKGKLPRKTIGTDYILEYGTATIEIHEEDLKPNSKVLIVDDLLATGGTISAIENLIKKAGSQVAGSLFLIELKDLNGRQKLDGKVDSLIKY